MCNAKKRRRKREDMKMNAKSKKAASRRYAGEKDIQKAEAESVMPKRYSVFICEEEEAENGTIAVPAGLTPEDAYSMIIGMSEAFALFVPGFMEYAGSLMEDMLNGRAESDGDGRCG